MGFLSKTLNRAKTGGKRLESMTSLDLYLDKVEWMDLGHDVLYAKFDMPLDYLKNSDMLSINDLNEIISNLPDDISIMNKNHIKWIKDNCKVLKFQNSDMKDSDMFTSICCISDITNEDIHFNLPTDTGSIQSIRYFLGYVPNKVTSITKKINYTLVSPSNQNSYLGTPKQEFIYITGESNDYKKYYIKLVKLK
ncbi:MAG: hypothetical protein NC548_30920 [Lachnospiraceae bacterium]|nr:hypothetical protein [Lachnospiraceae bacterium]